MDKMIPIFPLKLVVFPNSKYPLHIFEERYKIMINECLNQKSGFGIVLETNGALSKVGCYVLIDKVTKIYENGEKDIIVAGQHRFSVIEVQKHFEGYHVAIVKEYNDASQETNPDLISGTRNLLEEILEKLKFEPGEKFWNKFDSADTKSFKLAEKAGLSLEQQQDLLVQKNENERLNFLMNHFMNLKKRMDENSASKEIILGDGYIN